MYLVYKKIIHIFAVSEASLGFCLVHCFSVSDRSDGRKLLPGSMFLGTSANVFSAGLCPLVLRVRSCPIWALKGLLGIKVTP